jgi:hypothetical protein
MSIPSSFPDWMPWWAQLLIVVVGILLGLAFALMPFSVFGLKGRLDGVEARLDEIQGEIRSLALRLPEPARRAAYEEDLVMRATSPAAEAASVRPPIPPAAWTPDRRPIGTGRAEPRLNPPR